MFPIPYDNGFTNNQKIVEEVERFSTLSGQQFVIRKITYAIIMGMVMSQRTVFENSPPLADGRIATSILDVRECAVCLRLFFHTSVSMCPKCGMHYCHQCGQKDDKENLIKVCQSCYAENHKSRFKQFFINLWNLDK